MPGKRLGEQFKKSRTTHEPGKLKPSQEGEVKLRRNGALNVIAEREGRKRKPTQVKEERRKSRTGKKKGRGRG